MSFEKDVSLIWTSSKCGGVWLMLCYLSLKKENVILELVTVCSLATFVIIHVIDFLSSRVMYQNLILYLNLKILYFFENVFPMKNKENVLHDLIETTNEIADNVQELRRSKQARKENSFGNNFLAYVVE